MRVAKDFPSPTDPHRILGVLSVHMDMQSANADARNQRAVAALAQAAENAAAEHGGNAYYIDFDRAYVLHVSNAAPEIASAAQLLDEAKAKLVPARYRQIDATTRMLESFAPVTLKLNKGTCYGLAWALTPSAIIHAALGGRTMWALSAAKRPRKGPPARSGLPIGWAAPGLPARAHFVDLGCSGSDGDVAYRLAEYPSAAALGTGEVEVRVFAWQPSYEQRHAGCTVCRTGDGLSERCLATHNLTSGICE